MELVVDLDQVLVNIVPPWIEKVNSMLRLSNPLKMEEFINYDLSKRLIERGISHETIKKAYKLFDNDMYEGLPVSPFGEKMKEVIKKNSHHSFTLYTKSYGDIISLKKMEWLHKHEFLPLFDKIILEKISHDTYKHVGTKKVDACMLIDDHPTYHDDFLKHNKGKAFGLLVKQPWGVEFMKTNYNPNITLVDENNLEEVFNDRMKKLEQAIV